MEKVLLLGSSGFLGTEVLKFISEKEYNIDITNEIKKL